MNSPVMRLSRAARCLAASMALSVATVGLGVEVASASTTKPPDKVDWSKYSNHVFENQSGRTCYAHAIAAAIEARYSRDYGMKVDLSEGYVAHLIKSTSLSSPQVYRYENQSSFWGGGNSGSVEALRGHAVPTDQQYPTKTASQINTIRASIPAAGSLAWAKKPEDNLVTQANVDALEYSTEYIPLSARDQARYAVESWTRQGSVTDTEKVEKLLASGKEVIADYQTLWKKDKNGVYQYDKDATDPEFHVVLIVGYDRPARQYIVKNSWGENAFIRVSYDVFEQAGSTMSTIDSVTDPVQDSPAVQRGRALGVWTLDHDGWIGTLTIRRVPRDAQSASTATRLGDYQRPGEPRRAVNGYWSQGGRELVFRIAPVSNPMPAPGTMVGQEFRLSTFRGDITRSAGLTTAATGKEYGAVAMRPGSETRVPSSTNFQPTLWNGTWDMNHDGIRASVTLKVTSTSTGRTLSGTYRVSVLGTTVEFPVSGTLVSGSEHIARFTMGVRSYKVGFHTWQDRHASGSESVGADRFGVEMVRR